MTVTATEIINPSDVPSENGSWDTLPPSEPVELPVAGELPPDTTEEAPAGICRVCGDPIVRAPGTRGRMPKTHPECRNLSSVPRTSSGTVRSNKKEREAEEAVKSLTKQVLKGALLVAAADPYDGFCLMTGWTDVSASLKGVLVRHDKLRAEFLAINEGGSIFGLIIACITMIIPILAHHGILKFKQDRINQLLVELPKTLYKLRLKLADGEATLTKMMAEQMEEVQRQKQEQMRKGKEGAA